MRLRTCSYLLEAVSPGRKAVRRDYEEKTELYARGDVPLYLIVDPNNGTWLLQSDPDRAQGEYRTSHKGSFGEPVELPTPFDLGIPTDRFLVYPENA